MTKKSTFNSQGRQQQQQQQQQRKNATMHHADIDEKLWFCAPVCYYVNEKPILLFFRFRVLIGEG